MWMTMKRAKREYRRRDVPEWSFRRWVRETYGGTGMKLRGKVAKVLAVT